MEAEQTNAKALAGESKDSSRVIVRGKSHMPENSILFERIIPIALIAFGLITAALIVVAAGVLLGFIPFPFR